jgi:hypothetical protein
MFLATDVLLQIFSFVLLVVSTYEDVQTSMGLSLISLIWFHCMYCITNFQELPPLPTIIHNKEKKKYVVENHSQFAVEICCARIDDQLYLKDEFQKALEECAVRRGIAVELGGSASPTFMVDPFSTLDLFTECPMDLSIHIKFIGIFWSVCTPLTPAHKQLEDWGKHQAYVILSDKVCCVIYLLAFFIMFPDAFNILALRTSFGSLLLLHVGLDYKIQQFGPRQYFTPKTFWLLAVLFFISTFHPDAVMGMCMIAYFALEVHKAQVVIAKKPKHLCPIIMVKENGEMENVTEIPIKISAVSIHGLQTNEISAPKIQEIVNKVCERMKLTGSTPKVLPGLKQILNPKETVDWIFDAPKELLDGVVFYVQFI